MKTQHAIELVDVHAGYGRLEVLHGVNLAVPNGTVFALLGPNGGGKSTTLQVVSGAIRPTSGCVHIAGSHVNGASPDALARAGVTRIPEGRGIFPNLTVDDNLRIWTYAAGLSLRAVQKSTFARFPRLAERRQQRAGTMSGGEQQMLAMSRALVARPASPDRTLPDSHTSPSCARWLTPIPATRCGRSVRTMGRRWLMKGTFGAP
jgi:branched-chain amino acid transport system ATP-binding protein